MDNLIRSEAIECLHEMSDTSDLMLDVTHISLHIYDKTQIRLNIHSQFDGIQQAILRQIVGNRNLKAVECADNIWVIY